MTRFRLRIVLLALGVVFGYGSAFVHAYHHHGDAWHHRHGHCEEPSAKSGS